MAEPEDISMGKTRKAITLYKGRINFGKGFQGMSRRERERDSKAATEARPEDLLGLFFFEELQAGRRTSSKSKPY